MKSNRISGIPVVEAIGRLVGILTNRDVRFAENPRQPGLRADDARQPCHRAVGVGQEEARADAPPAPHRKAAGGRRGIPLRGLITVKDMDVRSPIPPRPRTRGPAARRRGDHGRRQGFERTEALVDAECDLIVIDTAHGHNRDVARAVERVKRLSQLGPVMAGNVAPPSDTPSSPMRRGRGQGRDRPGVDLHHARRRRRRRAAADRGASNAPSGRAQACR
jgi:IMP dehydrogenase